MPPRPPPRPRPRGLWAVLLVLLAASPAQARRLTYCVGGYKGRYPHIEATACNTPEVAGQHRRWHHHVFFRREADGACFDCWDEEDSSCDWDFRARNPGYQKARNPANDCRVEDNAQEIIDHVIDGQRVSEAVQPTLLTPEAGATTEDGRPLSAGESATLTGMVRDPSGAPRPLSGGRFRIVAPDGTTQEVAGQLQPDGTTVRGVATLPDADAVQITFLPELAAAAPGDTLQAGDRGQSIALRGPPTFPALSALDFGQAPAGSAPRARCQDLDLRGVRNLEGRTILLSLGGLGTCTARPLLATHTPDGAIDQLLSLEPGPHRLEVLPERLTFCLSVPLCSGEQAPPDAVLRLSPEDRPDRAAAVPLRWDVTQRSWLACHGIWLWPTLGALALGWLVAGFVRPRRFPVGATITVASDPAGLRRAAPVPLRECRGSRPGFYRDACLAVQFDGSVHGRQRGAAALLRATRAGVALLPRGTLEVYDRRKRQWHPPPADQTLLPTAGEIFRCGDVCFQIDPG